MPTKLGNTTLTAIRFNTTSLSKLYHGNIEIFSSYTPPTIYNINVNIVNGSYSGDSQVESGNDAYITFRADSYYSLPSSINLVGIYNTYSYNSGTGDLVIYGVSSDIDISVTCDPSYNYTVTVSINYQSNGYTAYAIGTIIDSDTPQSWILSFSNQQEVSTYENTVQLSEDIGGTMSIYLYYNNPDGAGVYVEAINSPRTIFFEYGIEDSGTAQYTFYF